MTAKILTLHDEAGKVMLVHPEQVLFVEKLDSANKPRTKILLSTTNTEGQNAEVFVRESADFIAKELRATRAAEAWQGE